MAKAVIGKQEVPEAPPSNYKFEKQRQEDARMVRGKFQDRELRGGTIKFPFRKYAGDDVVWYELTDGQEYDIPLGVAKHLNSVGYDTHKNLLGPDGLPIKSAHKNLRFSFISSEFN